MQPLSDRMIADIERRNMEKELPILVRIFKQESELEVWKEDKSGSYALLKTYPICRWSGELGPKVKEGDRQAPEGFYTITPGLMNPNSSYYLAINMGFPNAYDRANGRSGAFLMIHGDCSSRGCYAMTDEQIAEIYALARESFFGGQKSFQIQAYPFRMTPTNMAKHRNSPHMAFWKMLKQGYDHFELTRHEPKVDVCEKRYVFDAESSSKFSAAERCPAYKVPAELVAAVREKQRREEIQVGRAGQPRHPGRPGADRHRRRHESDLPGGREVARRSGREHPHRGRHHSGPRQSSGRTGPGDHDRKLHELGFVPNSKPAAAPRSSVQVASAAPTGGSGGIGGFFGNLFGSKEKEQPAELRGSTAETPKAKSAARPPQVAAAGAIRPKQSDTQQPEPKATARASKPPPAQETQRRAQCRRPSRPTARACSTAQHRRCRRAASRTASAPGAKTNRHRHTDD